MLTLVRSKDCLFGAVKLNKIVDPDKYCYSGYGIAFDSHSLYSVPNFNWCKNVVIFGVDNSSSVQIDIRRKDIFGILLHVVVKMENMYELLLTIL